jgi:DHA1 family solute carrier family 18 vesicular amine transporter 1/2
VNARRITIAVGLTMLVESTLYQAVVPLLPSYADRFHLSKAGAGLVLAAYPLPTPIIGLLSGLVTPRFGGRRMALAGSTLLTVSTIAFAVAPNVVVLDLARALQGCAAGITWAASMAWLSANTPSDRLPRESGIVMGLFSTGAVIGPGVGSFAHATSPLLAFSCLAGVAALTIPLVLRAPAGRTIAPERSFVRSIGSVLRNRLVLAAIILSVIDPVSLGAIDLLVPRGLHAHGVPTWHIGAALMIGAAFGAISGPLAGRRAQRIGPLRVGLGAAVALAIMPALLVTGLSDGAQLLLLVAVAPRVHGHGHGHVPALDPRRGRARRLARRRQRCPLGHLGDGVRRRLTDDGRAGGPPRRHRDLRDRRRRVRLADRDADDHRARLATARSRDLRAGLSYSRTPSTLSAASALKPRRPSSPSRWAGVRPAAAREASRARAAASSPASAARTPARAASSPTASRSRSASTRPGPQPDASRCSASASASASSST